MAFARGVERNVYFAMEGRPVAEAGEAAPSAAAVVRAVPVVLLADQGTRLTSGAHPPGTWLSPAGCLPDCMGCPAQLGSHSLCTISFCCLGPYWIWWHPSLRGMF